MVTTIRVSDDLKNILGKYKTSPRESYEDVIRKLIREREKNRQEEYLLLKEGYEEMYGLTKDMSKDFEEIGKIGFFFNEES